MPMLWRRIPIFSELAQVFGKRGSFLFFSTRVGEERRGEERRGEERRGEEKRGEKA
jgi:hypothetical protein